MQVPTQRGQSRNPHPRAHLRLEPLEDRTLLAAAVAPLFPEVQVNLGIPHNGGQVRPDVGVAADGSFVVTFIDAGPNPSLLNVYARRFNADGTIKVDNGTVVVATGLG